MQFLTPFCEYNGEIRGALYDSEGYLEIDSLRKPTIQGKLRPIDKASLSAVEMSNAQIVDGRFFFLGHCHAHYGHFLLETLPMISKLIRRRNRRGIFLPFGNPNSFDRSLLDEFLKLVDVAPSQVLIHQSNTRIIKLRAKCPKRPFLINRFDGLVEADSFKTVINEIKSRICLNDKNNSYEKVFLARDESRINQSIHGIASAYFARHGFKVVYPERLSIKEQILLMHTARLVVGYVGSQMHNSLFCQPGTIVVSLGDKLYPQKQLSNQVVCNQISGASSQHIVYTDDKNQLIAWLSKVIESCPDLPSLY